MNKREYCESRESIAYYSGLNGLEIKSYAIFGFTDKTKCANLYQFYKRKSNALNRIEKMKKSGCYQMIILREEIKYTSCGVETSNPILIIELC